MSGYVKNNQLAVKKIFEPENILQVYASNYALFLSSNISSPSYAINLSNSDMIRLNITSNVTLTFASPNKTSYMIMLSSTGNFNVTFPPAYWAYEGYLAAKVLSVTSSKRFMVHGTYDGADYFLAITEF